MEKKITLSLLRLSILGLFFVLPNSALAATLGFSPSTLSRAVENTFSVSVYVSSTDQAINAVSGVVSFPPGMLEVVGISKTNSIMSCWVQEPSFSNANGTVNFEGIAFNPGFTGSRGTVLSITFRAKNSRQAPVSFSSGTVLANDGIGTNTLMSMESANFSITSGGQVEEIKTPPASMASGDAPVIISTSHPDQSKWYTDSTPEFSWKLPSGAIEVRTLIGTSPNATPSVQYSPPISSKKVTVLPDGIYYFSLQIRTSEGWGSIARYRVNIDTTPPNQFSIVFPHGRTGWEPQPVILFNTTDNGSGISVYNLKIGDGGPERVAPPAEANPYPLPPQYPGIHTVTVIAIDEAGNTRSASEDFTIKAIDAPIVTYYQDEVESGDIIKIRGTTYPDSDVIILIKENDKVISEEYTRSNSSGDWAVVATKRLSPGAYTFTTRVTDGRGARSTETAPLNIIVNSKFIVDLIDLVLNYLSAVILVILSLALLLGGGAYVWYRSLRIVRKLDRKSREAEKVLAKAFAILRKDIASHIARLKSVKRELTAEEVVFLEQFEKELGEAEEVIAKEIQDVSHS